MTIAHAFLPAILAASVSSIMQGDDHGSVLADAGIEKTAENALEKRSWVQIPERQRNSKKRIANSMPSKGQKCSRGRAFSALGTFSTSKCSRALGSVRLAAVALLLRSAACVRGRWFHEPQATQSNQRPMVTALD